MLSTKYDEVDRGVLLVRLLQQEINFTTVEVNDLPALKLKRPEEGRVYIVGASLFLQPLPADGVVVASLTPKALDMVGDERLSIVAREAIPANAKTSKKAVELLGSTKVVTEKKALKRLGSEMTDEMRVLQLKTERKEKEEESRREPAGSSMRHVDGAEDGLSIGGGMGGRKATFYGPRSARSSPSSPSEEPLARRATRLLAEVPKYLTSASKADLSVSGGNVPTPSDDQT